LVSQQCEQDAECGSDRNLLLQLPGVHVDASVMAPAYPDVQMVSWGDVQKEKAIPDWRDATSTKELMKDMKMKTNSQGDLAAFVSSLMLCSILVCLCAAFFCFVRSRYPLVYNGNDNKEPIPDTRFGWMTAAWNLSTDQIEHAGGLDAAMLIAFVDLALKILLTIGVPMVLILCPLHFFAGELPGSHKENHDKLGQLGMGNIVEGEGCRWMYFVHAVFVWYVVVMVERLIFQAQELFLRRRNNWIRQMPRPRSTTVFVEGIPSECCSDDGLKEEFCKLFPGDMVDSAYVVKNTSKLEKVVAAYKSADQNLVEANFEWQAAGGTEDTRPLCRDWHFGKLVDKILFYTEQKREAAAGVAKEREALGDVSKSEKVNSNSGFVTFRSERDAAIALCLKVRADEYVFMMSTPPDPSDVQYADLYMDQSTLHLKAILGYLSVTAIFFCYTPIILAISSVVNLTALRKEVPLVEQLIKAVPMSERLLGGVLASAAITLFMSFLPTILMLIFDTFYSLKAGRWAQHRLQIWYFWFQIIFVLLVTAVGSSLWDTILTLVNHPTLIFELLANRLPTTTHFYLNFMCMQWFIHGLNLTRYINLSKFKALSVIVEEQRAKELSEPEDQDYYGMGARSARFTLNLVIALVYCSLCPLITVITGINFLICRVVYGYLLVFAEDRKPDLGGHFWVTQLQHVQYGLCIYVVLMVGVLSSRAATLGPTVVAAPAFIYLVRSYFRFHSEFQWEYMPFEEFTDKQKANWEASRESSRGSYQQPELTEPVLTSLK